MSMSYALPDQNAKDDRIVLGLLNSVEDGATSQRHIAAELGVALGLVNAYLKRCIKKGLVKVKEVPSRRYTYYLTPRGFTEKSRLTIEYLSSSFSFFRQAKADCTEVFALAKSRNLQNLVLLGKSDLAEIAILSAVESDVHIVAVVDRVAGSPTFVGKQMVSGFDALEVPVDAVIITDLRDVRASLAAAVELFGSNRVFLPKMLGKSVAAQGENTG
jgi:DNA-binding MarR family transcriptional regulator